MFELRTFKRQAADRQRAAEKQQFIMDIGFSHHLYDALLVELPFLGSDQFLRLRAVYQQLAQVNFLLELFAKPIVDGGRGQQAEERIGVDRRKKIGAAYTVALRVAQSRIDEALTALRAVAPARVFEAPLPEISELTEEEKALFGR